MTTLLEQAMSNPTRKGATSVVTDEQVDLVIGYLNGKVNLIQIKQLFEKKSQSGVAYTLLALLRSAYLNGNIDIIKK